MRLLIERFAYTKHGTLGQFDFEADDGAGLVAGYTIELPWRDNRNGESCIPVGGYRAIRHDSPTFGPTMWLQDVPGRSEILIHVANSPTDLDGCIGPGDDYGWWDDRDELAVWNSRDTLDLVLAEAADEIRVDIRPWQPEAIHE